MFLAFFWTSGKTGAGLRFWLAAEQSSTHLVFQAGSRCTRPAAELEKVDRDRKQQAEDLLWSLYNKVDFVYNY
jgi:hypothetical protein